MILIYIRKGKEQFPAILTPMGRCFRKKIFSSMYYEKKKSMRIGLIHSSVTSYLGNLEQITQFF